MKWHACDNPNEPGSSLVHLYELIQPKLTTLVELRLRINVIRTRTYDVFDLQLPKPVADTLRTFEYRPQSADESILDSIPAILPHLTKLSIRWGNDFTTTCGRFVQFFLLLTQWY